MEDHIKFITTAVEQLVEQLYHSGEDIHLLCEAVTMAEELDTLSSLLIPRLVTRKSTKTYMNINTS